MFSMLSSVTRMLLVCCVAYLVGCCAPEPKTTKADTVDIAVTIAHDTVALVNGRPIRASEVQAFINDAASETPLGPQAALEALIRNELLVAEAERHGVGQQAEVAEERKVALARVLLERRIGSGINQDTIDRHKLRQYYKANQRRFVHGVQRVVHHILVQSSKTGASGSDLPDRDIATEVRVALGERATPEQMKTVEQELSQKYPGRLRREELPPCEANDAIFVKPFVDAVFALPGEGAVSQPFETEFGWHVALFVEEIPASNRRFEEVEKELAQEVLPEEKKLQYQALVERLDKETGVFFYDEAIAQWLAQ